MIKPETRERIYWTNVAPDTKEELQILSDRQELGAYIIVSVVKIEA